MQALEVFTFDTNGWRPEPRIADARANERGAAGPCIKGWTNDHGDTLTAHFFQIAPDLPTPFRSVDELRDFHRPRVAENGGGIVEVEVGTVRGLFLQHSIYKFPKKPTGVGYLASLTFPFAQFSYVLKVQALESSPTGVREAKVLEERMKARGGASDPQDLLAGWMSDPYQPDWKGPCLRNEAEDPKYDARFPDHPLSRVRRTLAQLRGSVAFDRLFLKVAKPFPVAAAT
jgi:hypothetical protein